VFVYKLQRKENGAGCMYNSFTAREYKENAISVNPSKNNLL